MLNSKNFIYFLIPYFTICCSLYHLLYWGFFGLNGLALISTADIIKSAVKPLIVATLFSLFIPTIGYWITSNLLKFTKLQKPIRKHNEPVFEPEIVTDLKKKLKDIGYIEGQLKDIKNQSNQIQAELTAIERGLKRELIILVIFVLLLFALLITITYFLIPDSFSLTLCFCIGMVFSIFVKPDAIFSSDLNLPINKSILLQILILLPCFSISTAVQDAQKILTNRSYKYFLQNDRETNDGKDTLKFIGITEKNFVFTNLKNDKIYFLKQDTMTLQTNKKPQP